LGTSNPTNFVGREILLKQLATALEKNESISLIGDRRIGKTSLLKTWQQKVQAQQRPVIYVTGENYEAHDLGQFIKTITKLRCANEPEEAANVLSEWAEEQGKPPLILVDEAERFFENFPPRFFERLRGMLGDVVWIFASRDYIDKIYKEYHHDTSPFENRLALHYLGLLEPPAVEQLIRLGRLTSEEAALMHTWAGRHPFFLQLLGRCLLELRGQSLQVALDQFQTEADRRLQRIWNRLNDKEREALKQCLAGTPAELRSLRVRGLVTEEGYLFGQVLATWLEEHNQ
jgi:energy-coupling factor transporter ATP-binding protein EcfA2